MTQIKEKTTEISLAQQAYQYVTHRFPRWGINKQREIARLLYEISKRDNIPVNAILPVGFFKQYTDCKHLLLKRRYPHSFSHTPWKNYYLPQLPMALPNTAARARALFQPKHLYIEKPAARSVLAQKAQKAFPQAKTHIMHSLKEFLKNKTYTLQDYNTRTNNLYIIHQTTEFFKSCPCTSHAVHCGYNIMNLNFGCPYECHYCYLQTYQNVPGVILTANLQDFFNHFDVNKLKPGFLGKPRLGTGEFTDSLALDPLTEQSIPLIEFFRQFPQIDFEFKTKSTNIQNILKCPPADNIVVSWSLNPEEYIADFEPFTATLDERLSSAKQCAQAGYKIGFHFDPIIHKKDWDTKYKQVVEKLFAAVPPKRIVWISIGTLRFAPSLKTVIENRFPQTTLLDEELLLDFDNKMRYEKTVRNTLLTLLKTWIHQHAPHLPVYPCMEQSSLWTSSR